MTSSEDVSAAHERGSSSLTSSKAARRLFLAGIHQAGSSLHQLAYAVWLLAKTQFANAVEAFGTYPGGGKSPSEKLVILSGTSMAAPVVSGCAALLREAFNKWQGLTSLPAPLMKALLINGTDNLGLKATEQGFGRLNLIRTLRHLESTVASSVRGSGHAHGTFQKEDIDKIKEFKTTVPGRIASNSKLNFVATLVYHDYWGEEIQNRMNLIVTYKGQKKETFDTVKNENVLRLGLSDVAPGEVITIGVQPMLLVVGIEVP